MKTVSNIAAGIFILAIVIAILVPSGPESSLQLILKGVGMVSFVVAIVAHFLAPKPERKP